MAGFFSHFSNPRAIMLLFAANTISGFAQGISMIAIPWYFSDIVGRPSLFGATYAAFTVLALFWSLYSGTLVDRYNRKKIFMALNGVEGTIVGMVAMSGFILGQVPIPLVLLAFGTTFLVFHLHYPTLYAFGQEITQPKNYGRVNSYIEIQGQLTNVAAGGMTAILLSGHQSGPIEIFGWLLPFELEVEPWTLHEIFTLDFATYLISLSLIGMIDYTPQADRHQETGSIWQRLRTGWNYLRERPRLAIFGIASYAIFALTLTHIFFLMAMYVNNGLDAGADVFGSGEIFFAAGAIFAGVLVWHIYRNTNSLMGIIINLTFGGLVLLLFFLVQNVWVFLIGSLFLGLSNAGTRILRITYLFNMIPNQVIGRTSSVLQVANILMRIIFIGLFSLPFFAEGNNVIWAYLVFGLFCLAAAGVLLFYYPKMKKDG